MSTPTVVVVPGLGGTPRDWDAMTVALPPGVAVLVVDPARAPRLRARDDWAPEAVALRLRAATDAAPAPFVLVGHSSGGLHVQAFLHLFGDLCSGAVLVDASHEESVHLVPWPLSAVGRVAAEVAVATGVAGWVAPALRSLAVSLTSVRRRDPLDTTEIAATYGSRAWAWSTLDAWFGHGPLQAGVLALQDALGPPPVPVTLVVGVGREGPAGRWEAVQRDLARRLGTHDVRVLDDAAHLVNIDRPDAVAAAVSELLDRAQATMSGR